MFIRFDRMYERNRQTDERTPHDDIGHACIAKIGQNHRAKVVDRRQTQTQDTQYKVPAVTKNVMN